MKQIEATILGQSYMLACPPGGEQLLQQAVAIVDREMSAIRDAGRVKARERIAVLTALNLAYLRADSARQGATAEPAAQPAPTAAAGSPPPSQEPASDDDALVERLIARLDAALGDDGRLL